jgi:hypothetical protein
MQALTLLIAAAGCVLVLCTAPIYGLVIYIATLAWYPTYLTVKIGTIDFNVTRIVILAIYVNLFLRTNLPQRLKFIWLDKLVIIYFLCEIAAGAITAESFMMFIENRAGGFLDMVLPYFAVRMIITTKEQYLMLLKSILVIAMPLAIIGFYQCITGNNPVGFLKKYYAWKVDAGYIPIPRHGFFRADATFPMSIMFGLFFAMFGPVCAGILHSEKKHNILYWSGLGLTGVGIFSSMSSGPFLAGLLSIMFIAFYRYRRYWKPVVIILILMCGTVEIISNRHFYDVLGSFTLSPATAWYRSKLIDVALFQGGMNGHWLTGFGYNVDPGWGPKLDGRNHSDVVNHYLVILCRYGLVGLLPFLTVIVAAIKKLIEAFRASLSDADKWLIWCLSGALFGILVAMSSVMLFGPPVTIFYIMLGFCGVVLNTIQKPNNNNLLLKMKAISINSL